MIIFSNSWKHLKHGKIWPVNVFKLELWDIPYEFYGFTLALFGFEMNVRFKSKRKPLPFKIKK